MRIHRFTCRKPIDFHCHFRQDDLLRYLVWQSGEYFSKALAMPNTLPAILSSEDVIRYGKELQNAATVSRPKDIYGPEIEFLLTFKIVDSTSPDSILLLKQAGAIAGKLYPGGVTTNSEDGVKDFKRLYPVFAEMERHDLVLCVHAELPGSPIETAEVDFLPILQDIIDNFPELRVVFEHISTAVGVEFVKTNTLADKRLGATVTPHHLLLSVRDVFNSKGIENPHHYCKPVCKTETDLKAIRKVVLFDHHPAFFLGTDSAPHSQKAKQENPPSAGIYNVSTAIPLLIQQFERAEALQRFEYFTSINGEKFYGLEHDDSVIEFRRKKWTVPEFYDVYPSIGLRMKIKPLAAGQELEWDIVRPDHRWSERGD